MPATPAWPPTSTPRLYVRQPLADLGELMLEGAQAHYLAHVMRIRPGDPVRLFDNIDGEWLGIVTHIGKRDLLLRLDGKLRPREIQPDLWLLMAPIKKGRIDWMAEKATELGVARIVPVLTQRTIIDRINSERLYAHVIEAAEQCDRTALPELDPLVALPELLKRWPAERALIFADEAGGVAMTGAARPGPSAILIGPEGGFTPEERELIRALPQATAISLGPRILRADTAAAAAISLWMAAAGDWVSG